MRNTVLTVLLWAFSLLAAVPLVSVLYMLVTRGGQRLGLTLFTELPPPDSRWAAASATRWSVLS